MAGYHRRGLFPGQAAKLAAWTFVPLAAALAFAALALAFAFPPLTGRVVDEAGVIPQAVSGRVTAKLASLESKSGIQLVVATVRTLGDAEIEPYANALFRAWGLGEKTKNNGVLLIVAPNEHKVRIEVGYGLEGTLTDALSKIIITNAMVPRFKTGDFGGGIERGVDDIITVLTTDSADWQQRPDVRIVRNQDSTVDQLTPFIVFGFFVLIFFLLTPRRERGNFLSFLLGMMMSSGDGRYRGRYDDRFGSGWGGDGFSGGGGSSGGGGASGSW